MVKSYKVILNLYLDSSFWL